MQTFCSSLPEKGDYPLFKVRPLLSLILNLLSFCYVDSSLLINFMLSSTVSKAYTNLYHLFISFMKTFHLWKAFLPGHQRDCVLAANRPAFPHSSQQLAQQQSHTAPLQPHHPGIKEGRGLLKEERGERRKPKLVEGKNRGRGNEGGR